MERDNLYDPDIDTRFILNLILDSLWRYGFDPRVSECWLMADFYEHNHKLLGSILENVTD